MKENRIIKLTDNTISHFAKLIQVAILTGTDLVDHMRMIELNLNEESNELSLNQEYASRFEEIINDMLNNLPKGQ